MNKIESNPNKEIWNIAHEALIKNNGYCPCKTVKNDDTKCMCKAFRTQNVQGYCHCGRFVKVMG